MFQIPLSTSSTIIQQHKFWDATFLYYNRPHLVNRKVTAASTSVIYEVSFNSTSVKLLELLTRPAILYEIRKLKDITTEALNEGFLRRLLESYDKNLKLREVCLNDLKDYSGGLFISIRILFPRLKNCLKAIEVITFDKEYNKITFLAVSDSDKLFIAPPFAYQIELTNSLNLRININSFEDADTVQAEWLVDKLFLKLLKWIEEEPDAHQQAIQSLSLIKADEYCLTYNRLKETYGEKLVKKWPTKSGTDPQKYVFEDIAIASYLICLWKNDTNVKFVDCGCGNGLLVFLLNQEGYEGFGLDVRRRPIWDIYPKSTKLEVGTVGPNSLFPDCTWLIGNHSDELTPWIPVIALKSSPNTNFWVLPCCPYDFNGRKYIRKNTSISAYADYLSYIEEISQKSGFMTDIDKLRIPSTKRTCLIGRRTHLDVNLQKNIIEDITMLVKTKISENFTQRTDIEKARNCTQLDKGLMANIIKICVNTLLLKKQFIKKCNGETWNKGSELQISDLVQRISKDTLKQLKQECGGLQTLLRNHRYLFEVTNGLVKIRLPVGFEESSKYKDKPCWFVKNHPDGCLYEESKCGYKH